MTAFDLESTYLFLDGAGAVTPAPVGPDFWATIGSNPLANGTMVTVSGGQGAWAQWEIHPTGDEVLVVLEGAPRIWLEHPDGRLEQVTGRPGSTIVVPRGAWHRAESEGEHKLLFITFGEGTTHRPVTDADRARAAQAPA